MKTITEMIEVMEAFKNKEIIESKKHIYDNAEWVETLNPSWDWLLYDYRVKKQKKKLYLWALKFKNSMFWQYTGIFYETEEQMKKHNSNLFEIKRLDYTMIEVDG